VPADPPIVDVAADLPAALLNLGYLLRRQHRLAAARGVLERCANLTPADPAVWLNLTATYVNEGEPVAGEAVARAGLSHCPASPDVRWNLGLLLLEQGRWREGWREYVHRFDTPVLQAPCYGPGGERPPRLAALDDLRPGQLVVCHGEQGLGDEILFAGMLAEFLAAARDRGAKVVLDCQRRLRSVFARNFDGPLLGDGSAAGRAALDLVVTVPTSVLHVAGSLGVPCLVAMHHRAAWRECSRDGRIPWYPKTHERFVRKPGDDGWAGVIGRVAGRISAGFSRL